MAARKTLWLTLLVVVSAAVGFVGRGLVEKGWDPGGPPNGKPVFDFIVGGPDPFWNQVIAGAEAAADELDVDLQVHVPSGRPADQTEVLASLDPRASQGIAISPIAPDAQSLLLSRLAAKTFIITFDNDAPQSLRHCYVGTNNLVAGGECAKVVQEGLPEGGNVIIFIGDDERQNAQDRLRGFHDQIVDNPLPEDSSDYRLDEPYDGAEIHVLQIYFDGQDPDQAEKNVRQAVAEHSDVDCMVGLYGYNGPACLKVLNELGKTDDIMIIAFDEHEETLDGVANGQIYATVVQNTFRYGFETVRLLKTWSNSKEHFGPLGGTGYMYLPCKIVTKENVADHRADLAKRISGRKAVAK